LIEGTETYKEMYLKYQDEFSEGDLLKILAYLSRLSYEIRNNGDQRMKMEVGLCNIIGIEKSQTISQLLNIISSSEINISSNVNDKKINYSTAPIIKEKANSAPKVEAKEKDIIQKNEINVGSINEKWKSFLDLVNVEKFTLGAFLEEAEIISADTKIVNIYIENPENRKYISKYSDYLEDKSKDIFGANMRFNFLEENKPGYVADLSQNKIVQSNPPQKNEKSNEDTSLVDSIIKNLGGVELK